MNDAEIRTLLVSQFEDGRDLDETHEMYHDDAVLEFPQSGERFIGRENFLTWRKQYPADVTYRIRRITGRGDVWILELLVSYNEGPPMFGLGLVQLRGGKIARETIYVMEGFEAASWRAEWATRFDPLASASAEDWRDGDEYGIDAVAAAAR